MHFSVSGHVILGVVRWRQELHYFCSLCVLSKFGPIEAYMCRVIASWFFPSNGIKRYLNGPLNQNDSMTIPFGAPLEHYKDDTPEDVGVGAF